jgi:hypothetical protein
MSMSVPHMSALSAQQTVERLCTALDTLHLDDQISLTEEDDAGHTSPLSEGERREVNQVIGKLMWGRGGQQLVTKVGITISSLRGEKRKLGFTAEYKGVDEVVRSQWEKKLAGLKGKSGLTLVATAAEAEALPIEEETTAEIPLFHAGGEIEQGPAAGDVFQVDNDAWDNSWAVPDGPCSDTTASTFTPIQTPSSQPKAIQLFVLSPSDTDSWNTPTSGSAPASASSSEAYRFDANATPRPTKLTTSVKSSQRRSQSTRWTSRSAQQRHRAAEDAWRREKRSLQQRVRRLQERWQTRWGLQCLLHRVVVLLTVLAWYLVCAATRNCCWSARMLLSKTCTSRASCTASRAWSTRPTSYTATSTACRS